MYNIYIYKIAQCSSISRTFHKVTYQCWQFIEKNIVYSESMPYKRLSISNKCPRYNRANCCQTHPDVPDITGRDVPNIRTKGRLYTSISSLLLWPSSPHEDTRVYPLPGHLAPMKTHVFTPCLAI